MEQPPSPGKQLSSELHQFLVSVCFFSIFGFMQQITLASSERLFTQLWRINNNNNDRFTALVRDYPGELVPEETLTYSPS